MASWRQACLLAVSALSLLAALLTYQLLHHSSNLTNSCILLYVCLLVISLLISACLLDVASYDPAASFTVKQVVFQYFVCILFRTIGFLCYRKLLAKLGKCEEVQAKTLMSILQNNLDTTFGRDHQFEKIKNREDYRRCIPLMSYEDMQPYISRIAEGEQKVLTTSKVVFLALTSGTTGQHKMYPVTERHKKDTFHRTLGSLYKYRNRLITMKRGFFLRLFPQERHSRGGIPMAGATVHVFKPSPADLIPRCQAKLKHERPAFLVQAVFALRERDIDIVGAFSSNNLHSFLRYCVANWEYLCSCIEHGRLSEGDEEHMPWEVVQELNAHLTPSPARADQLRHAFSQGRTVGLAKRIWPNLKAVLAPNKGGFALAAQRDQESFLAGVPYFYLGHGASEGTFGLSLEEKPEEGEIYTLVTDSCFLEFIPQQNLHQHNPTTVFMEEVVVGQQYELVLTSPDGLYRYRLGDVIEIVGHKLSTPKYKFLYRVGQSLDLVGEKTPESLVYEALQKTCSMVDYTSTESLAIEHLLDLGTSYVIFIELQRVGGAMEVVDGMQIDGLLCELHTPYRVFREKGSIQAIQVITVMDGTFEELRGRLCGHYQNMQFKMPRVLRKEEHLKFLLESKIRS